MLTIEIWIVEDDASYRRSLRSALKNEKDITCSRIFPSCVEFFHAIERETAPSIVLMDLGLPDISGVEGIKRLLKINPGIAVLVLTVFEDKEKVRESLRAGAVGYLLKTATGDEIAQGIRNVFMGGSTLSPNIAKMIVKEMQKSSDPAGLGLSDREIEVLENLAEDLSAKEIADRLGISRRTVAFHLENIYRKLGVHSQSGAVAKSLRSGII